jgi:membrane protein implicated in regulation of membrane protease activity
MIWWYWVVLGLVLMALELATPGGFFVVFFGVSALLVGLLELAGIATADWMQWLLFPLVALVALALFREPLLRWMRLRDGVDEVDSLVGTVAIAAGDIAPGQHGRAELRGTGWSARNVGATPLAAGQRCRVVAVHGLMLDLREE